jgi:hypothetical protein
MVDDKQLNMEEQVGCNMMTITIDCLLLDTCRVAVLVVIFFQINCITLLNSSRVDYLINSGRSYLSFLINDFGSDSLSSVSLCEGMIIICRVVFFFGIFISLH